MSFLTSKAKLLVPCGQNIARIIHDTQSYRPLISSGEFNVVIITIKNRICISLKKTLSVLIKLAQTILVALSARNCEKIKVVLRILWQLALFHIRMKPFSVSSNCQKLFLMQLWFDCHIPIACMLHVRKIYSIQCYWNGLISFVFEAI